MYYYFTLLKVFYSSIVRKRIGNLNFSFDPSHNVLFSLKHLKDIPFIPDLYSRNKSIITTCFYIKSNSKKKSLLLVNYFTNLR